MMRPLRHTLTTIVAATAIAAIASAVPPEMSRERMRDRIELDATVQDLSGKSQTPTDRQIAIGRMMWDNGQDDKAEELFHEALNKAQSMNDRRNATDVLAEFYRWKGQYDRAVKAYESLRGEAERTQDFRTMIHAYAGLGNTFADAKDFVRAIKFYGDAEDLLDVNPDTAAMADVLTGKANTLLKGGDVREALRLIKLARNMTSEDDLDRITVILRVESNIEAELKDFETAYATMNEYSRLRRKLRDREADNLMSNNGYGETEEMRYRLAEAEGVREAVGGEQEAERKMAFMASFVLCILLLVTLSGLAIVIRRMLLNRAKEREMRLQVKEADRVLHIVGHDATNQFNTLLGFASILVDRTSKVGGDEEMFAKRIYSSAQTLYQMTSNLLTWSKSKTQMKPKRCPTVVSKSLEEVLQAMRVVAGDKEITIDNKISDDIVAYCDPSHLAIIVRNLVGNSIKFTKHYGKVTLSSTTYGGKLLILVEDDGIGMSVEDIAKFNRDETLTSTQGTDNEKGNGIGLTICRELAKANGGDLIIEPGRKKGTAITLVLPSITDNKQ